jgi:hypothetical protein
LGFWGFGVLGFWGFGGRMMMDKGGYGITGKIIKIDSDKIFVLGTDNIEKIITVSSTTKVFERRDEIKLSDLKIDQNIVTIGNPDSMGQINAKLIRIMPFINNK